MPAAVGQLGCPQEYTAIIHWRGGSRPYMAAGSQALTAVAWNRVLNDVSEASVTFAKGKAPECCGELGDIEPWIHELSIYRDGELVWQGPVTKTVESRYTFRVEAQDVMAWLGRTINTEVLRYVDPLDPSKPAGPVQQIAESIITLNVNNVVFSFPPDWCNIIPFIVREDSTTITKFEKDGSTDASIWLVPVLKILDDELVPRGLEYTTVGRSILLSRAQTSADQPVASLTLDDIAGEVEIIKDGASGSAIMWATNQVREDISDAAFGLSGFLNTAYGRLDSLVLSQAEDMDGYDLLQLAQASQVGRFPVPIGLSVPNGSQLLATAPVTIDQLIAGRRINVLTTGMCSNVTQAYRLSDIDVEWGESGEQVAMSLIPLANDPAPPTTP